MPTEQTQHAETANAPAWAQFAQYTYHQKNSTATPKDKALSEFFYCLDVLRTVVDGATDPDLHTTDSPTVVKVTQHRLKRLGLSGADAPIVEYFQINPQAINAVVKQYIEKTINPRFASLKEEAKTGRKTDAEVAILRRKDEELRKVFDITRSPMAMRAVGKILITVLPFAEGTEDRIHVFDSTTPQNAADCMRSLVSAFDAGQIDFDAPIVPQGDTEHDADGADSKNEKKLDKLDIGTVLRAFFTSLSKHNVAIPPMPEVDTLPHKGNVFAYALSSTGTPSLTSYFTELERTPGAPPSFVEASKYIAHHFEKSPAVTVYFIATMHKGQTAWSYFTDLDEAKSYMGAQVVRTNEVFRERLTTAFEHCEAFKNHSNHEDPADFVLTFLNKADESHYSLLTAFSTEEAHTSASKNPAQLLPEIHGVCLHHGGSHLNVSIFDAKAVFVDLADKKKHLDKHGNDLVDNLMNHGMWANLIDFAESLSGLDHLLKVGHAETKELPNSPDHKVLDFAALFNQLW